MDVTLLPPQANPFHTGAVHGFVTVFPSVVQFHWLYPDCACILVAAIIPHNPISWIEGQVVDGKVFEVTVDKHEGAHVIPLFESTNSRVNPGIRQISLGIAPTYTNVNIEMYIQHITYRQNNSHLHI